MSPRRKKWWREKYRCDVADGERFHTHIDEVFRHNWWDTFCFPYVLCARLWDSCVALCAGTNQCLVYWLVVEWVACKITRLTTPNPIIFPYYFYMFCQVISLTLIFVLLWLWLGKTVFIPYFNSLYKVLIYAKTSETRERNATKLLFRRYCFRKSEIFNMTMDSAGSISSHTGYLICGLVDLFLYELI